VILVTRQKWRTEHRTSQGGITYIVNGHDQIADLTVQWEKTVTDPKASLLPTFAYFNGTVKAITVTFKHSD